MTLLSGCATMNKNECLTADWYAIGFEDGARGESTSYLSTRRQACAEYGVTPDFSAYQKGRGLGIREYCTPANGFARGQDGQTPAIACPADMAAAFTQAYQDGLIVYEAASRLRRTQSDIYQQQDRISKIKGAIDAAEKRLVSEGIRSTQRKEFLSTIKSLNKDLVNANTDLLLLEQQQYKQEQDLQFLKNDLRPNPG